MVLKALSSLYEEISYPLVILWMLSCNRTLPPLFYYCWKHDSLSKEFVCSISLKLKAMVSCKSYEYFKLVRNNTVHIREKQILYTYVRNKYCTHSWETNPVHIREKQILYTYVRNKYCTHTWERNTVHIREKEIL